MSLRAVVRRDPNVHPANRMLSYEANHMLSYEANHMLSYEANHMLSYEAHGYPYMDVAVVTGSRSKPLLCLEDDPLVWSCRRMLRLEDDPADCSRRRMFSTLSPTFP
ncbi:hypothetical protein CBR_g41695 [Chara braunii]|uniref:Uncharacterized protein n=1 Tax=Chara braunii TaxID=69332 RepID=A0A388LWP1_CHABU|nr:hypothetical protein CBR_g41695 [Chara braunii]|eukprot:GBG86632.1 hypothetical protein CBR_g41695 [Chara braunii]